MAHPQLQRSVILLGSETMIVLGIFEGVKVLLYKWNEAPVQGIQMDFVVWLKQALLFQNEDVVEQVQDMLIDIPPHPLNSVGKINRQQRQIIDLIFLGGWVGGGGSTLHHIAYLWLCTLRPVMCKFLFAPLL